MPAGYLLTQGLGNFDAVAGAAPATPTVTFSDDADGSATVTVSGSSAGSSNQLYYATWDGTTNPLGAWTLNASAITGDGNIASTVVGAGFYMFKVTSTLNSQTADSQPAYGRITSGTTAVGERILTSVQSKIQGLSLSGITSSLVVLQKYPKVDKNRTLPHIIIAPWQSEENADGPNDKNDRIYNVVIAFVDKGNDDNDDSDTVSRARFLKWREDVYRTFHNSALTGVPEVYLIDARPSDIANKLAWENQYLAGGMILKIKTREIRTVV